MAYAAEFIFFRFSDRPQDRHYQGFLLILGLKQGFEAQNCSYVISLASRVGLGIFKGEQVWLRGHWSWRLGG